MFSLYDVILDNLYPCFLHSDIHFMHFGCMYINVQNSIAIDTKTNRNDLEQYLEVMKPY